MRFRWDEAKARANRRKHGIDFADAVGVFEDLLALTREDEHWAEDRFVTIGVDLMGEVVVVVWSWRGEDVRIISARRPTRAERRAYAEGEDAR